MITVTIRANGISRTAQALPTQNIGEFLSANGINAANTAVYLNGGPLTPTILNQTFAAAGITDNALVSSVTKTANA